MSDHSSEELASATVLCDDPRIAAPNSGIIRFRAALDAHRPPSHPNLPGFDTLVLELSPNCDFANALKYLYREDVRQLSFKLSKHYLCLKYATDAPCDVPWSVVSDDLQNYSRALEQWNRLDRGGDFQHGLRERGGGRSTVLLAARSYAAEIYEQRRADQIVDPKATRRALEAERRAIQRDLCADPSAFDCVEIAAERNSREEKEKLATEQKHQRLTAFLSRFFMALFGGVAVIVPMVIMSLHDTRSTCIATTSVCTILVAILLSAFMTTAEAKDVVAATAAYAAVLVVFVGTTAQPIPNEYLSPASLSKGAVAGIVFGVLGAIFGLFALFLFFCMRDLFDGLLAVFGLRWPSRRREPMVTVGS